MIGERLIYNSGDLSVLAQTTELPLEANACDNNPERFRADVGLLYTFEIFVCRVRRIELGVRPDFQLTI